LGSKIEAKEEVTTTRFTEGACALIAFKMPRVPSSALESMESTSSRDFDWK
jgi:hypothetical protein